MYFFKNKKTEFYLNGGKKTPLLIHVNKYELG